MMEVGPVPEQREDGGIIERRRRGKPAELPRILPQREILAGQGAEPSGGLHRCERENKKTFKNEKTKGEKGRRLLFFRSAVNRHP